MGSSNFVQLRNISKVFGDNVVIRDLNLDIEKGTMVTLLGPSGCGKTTVLRLVAGLEKPTSGQILIDGEDVTHKSIQHRDICMVFQSYALFPHMSLFENVAYGLRMINLSKDEVIKRVDEALNLVDLAGMGERYVDQISGGQQQRVALARALVLKPKVLLFDEPLSNLDANLRRSMREKIREIQQKLNITSLYVTHDQSEAFAVSDTVIVMKDGQIMQMGPPKQLYKHPNSLFMANFMGEVNILAGFFDSEILTINGYGFPINQNEFGALSPGKHIVGLRPEAIKLSSEGEMFEECEIKHIAYMGAIYEVQVKWGEEFLFLQLNSVDFDEQIKKKAYIKIHPAGVFVLPS